MPTEHYQSPEAYRRARAYTHLHGIPTHAKRVCVRGVGCHAVKHGKKRKGGGRGTGKRNRAKT